MSRVLASVLVAVPLLLASCITHRVSFGDLTPCSATSKQGNSVAVVIDRATREQECRVSSAMAGIANKWVVQTGQMLVQMCDTEMPAVFASYVLHETAPAGSVSGIVLFLTVPKYQFADMHAMVTLGARATDGDGKTLFEKTYAGTGEAQGGKVFMGGAFAMKSALRQSSHSAFVQVFEGLMRDLASAPP